MRVLWYCTRHERWPITCLPMEPFNVGSSPSLWRMAKSTKAGSSSFRWGGPHCLRSQSIMLRPTRCLLAQLRAFSRRHLGPTRHMKNNWHGKLTFHKRRNSWWEPLWVLLPLLSLARRNCSSARSGVVFALFVLFSNKFWMFFIFFGRGAWPVHLLDLLHGRGCGLAVQAVQVQSVVLSRTST